MGTPRSRKVALQAVRCLFELRIGGPQDLVEPFDQTRYVLALRDLFERIVFQCPQDAGIEAAVAQRLQVSATATF